MTLVAIILATLAAGIGSVWLAALLMRLGLGGVVGYFLVGQLQDFLPYFLAVASSSFVYVALADLIPQLQKRLTARETIAQIAWLIAGMVIVTLVSGAAHAH